MNNPELNHYETANLKIDEDRVLTYSNIACPLDCTYCFANEISYAFGYYSGPMYLKELSEKTITAEELSALGCTVSEEVEDVHWMPKGNRFLKIETPALMSHLRNKIEQADRIFFEGAADGMDYLREHKYAQH